MVSEFPAEQDEHQLETDTFEHVDMYRPLHNADTSILKTVYLCPGF